MNTKFGFFLTFFLLLTGSSAPAVSGKQKDIPVISLHYHPGHAQQKNEPVDLLPFGHTEPVATGSAHPDDDGKSHYFHFERFFYLRRGRTTCILCAKAIVTIIHLASLLLGYMSVSH